MLDTATASAAAEQAIDQFGTKIKQLLSYGSGIALLRRSIRNAYNTIKELDAAMTETATVTDYSVSQMWQKLDDYTNIANELGATTLGTYKTITLFFQQGLNEAQALSLATETMKMARVAGIDYAEATEYMTSALRGFNMELNETSATRVNDVYSELAKITAADTNQIAIAMSKVASLANSANMELETTSAFLSQIIETTQEAPETAGTALKTIIARFSEVKKLFDEGDITGTDENGDVIDVNKIGAALRNIGIDLNQYIAGNVGLDQIFLELAEKWDGLSLVQQRYIATQAAGSRQQSRFIAMMQNYSRTMELVNAAYNSAGSGQEQFEKTLESLDSKLNKLQNAWNSFSMSIANSDIVKGAVDLFTSFLTVINDLSDAFGPLNGALKVFLGFGIFKGANSLLGGANGPLNAFLTTLKKEKDLSLAVAAGNEALLNSYKNLSNSISSFVNPSQLYQQRNQLNTSYINAAEQGDIDNMVKFNNELNLIDKQLDSLGLTETEAKFRSVGNTISIGASSLILFGTALKKIGTENNNAVLEKIGGITTAIGAFGTAAGQVVAYFPKLQTGFTNLATSLNISSGGLITIIGLLGALAATLTVVISNQVKYNKSVTDSVTTITDQITGLAENASALKTLDDEFNSLTKGTVGWSKKLEEIESKIASIIEKYPELEKFIEFNKETGLFEFDEVAYQKYETSRLAAKNLVRQGNEFQQATSYQYRNTVIEGQGSSFAAGFEDTSWAGTLSEQELNEIATQAKEAVNKYYNKETVIRELEAIIGPLTEEQKKANLGVLKELLRGILGAQYANNLVDEKYATGELVAPLTDKTGQNIYATYNGNGKELTDKLDLKLSENSTAQALKTYWENLDSLERVIGRNTNALRALALETADAMKNYDAFNKVLKDNRDILESGEKEAMSYGVAVAEAYNAAKAALGEALSYDYFESNLPTFLAAFVDGSEEAFLTIQSDLVSTFDLAGWLGEQDIPVELNPDDIALIQQEIYDLITGNDMVVNGYANFTDIYNHLQQIGVQGAQLAQALAQALSMEAHFVTDKDGNVTRVNVSSPGLQSIRNYRANNSGSNKKSGGGSSKKEKPWENPYDQLYNLTERNEEAIRRRNILEKQYNAILRDREGSSDHLLKNNLKELANLQEQLAYQRQLQAGRLQQLNNVANEMYMDSEGNRKSYAQWGVTQYAKYNQNTNAIEIDWNAIDKVTDNTTGKAIEDYIKRLEELQKLYEQTNSDILDIEAEVDEINQRGKNEFLTYEQRIYDAIVQTYQDVIDSFSSLNDTINDSNDKIMNGLQEQIDLERQIRDNTKAEEEIGQKEARLAYLQRDTSGANATEILRLQAEIDNARQDYSDSLIDQQIETISKGNEVAAEQRQTQITLMQEQLDYWSKIGAFWSRVSTLIDESINEDGTLKNNSALVELLMETDNFGGLSKFGQMNWMDDLVKTFMQSMEGYGKWMMEQAEKNGTIVQDGNTYTYDKNKKVWMLGNEAYSAMYNPTSQRYEFSRNQTNDVKVGSGSGNSTSGGGSSGGSYSGGSTTYQSPSTTSSTSKKSKYNIRYQDGWTTTVTAMTEDMALNTAAEWYRKAKGISADTFPVATWKKYASASWVGYVYAKGGLADFTGPAWLDGSKSHPEAVLSAKQTEMFISLRDLLERITQSGGLTSNSFGNTYVDLDVNADIGSDYDVDSLVNRLKRDILESSSYRNVNALSRGH